MDLLTIQDAAKRGISKLRLPRWANPRDHIEIHITAQGEVGPWVKLWSEMNPSCGFENPHKMLITEVMSAKLEWAPYLDEQSGMQKEG